MYNPSHPPNCKCRQCSWWLRGQAFARSARDKISSHATNRNRVPAPIAPQILINPDIIKVTSLSPTTVTKGGGWV